MTKIKITYENVKEIKKKERKKKKYTSSLYKKMHFVQ